MPRQPLGPPRRHRRARASRSGATAPTAARCGSRAGPGCWCCPRPTATGSVARRAAPERSRRRGGGGRAGPPRPRPRRRSRRRRHHAARRPRAAPARRRGAGPSRPGLPVGRRVRGAGRPRPAGVDRGRPHPRRPPRRARIGTPLAGALAGGTLTHLFPTPHAARPPSTDDDLGMPAQPQAHPARARRGARRRRASTSARTDGRARAQLGALPRDRAVDGRLGRHARARRPRRVPAHRPRHPRRGAGAGPAGRATATSSRAPRRGGPTAPTRRSTCGPPSTTP